MTGEAPEPAKEEAGDPAVFLSQNTIFGVIDLPKM
jgi:hypothetical protein